MVDTDPDHHFAGCILCNLGDAWHKNSSSGQPNFVEAEEADFMSANDQVVEVSINGKAKAYPLKILTWHEIVNDSLGGKAIVVSYCPLCRSDYVFNRKFKGY